MNINKKLMKNKEKELLGKKSIATNGQVMIIIAYRSSMDIDVQFDDKTVVYHKALNSFKKGNIKNPNYKNHYPRTNEKAKTKVIKKSEVLKKDRLWNKNIATNGHTMTIIAYRNSNDIDVQFDDETIVYHKTYSSFKKGNIRKPEPTENHYFKKDFKNIRIGEVSYSTSNEKMIIIGYRTAIDIDIQFEDGTIAYHKIYAHFKVGKIKNPSKDSKKYTPKTNIKRKCTTKVENSILKIGESSISRKGEKMTIITYKNSLDIDVQFDDKYDTVVKHITYQAFQTGYVKNPNYYKYRIGETNISLKGEKITIIDYRSFNNIDIQFEDGTVVYNKNYGNFKKGIILNPNYYRNNRIGNVSVSNKGQKMMIVDYRKCIDIDVLFEDNTIVTKKTYSNFKQGYIKNPNYYDFKLTKTTFVKDKTQLDFLTKRLNTIM